MSPKPIRLAVLLCILLPILSFSQQFSVNNVIRSNDEEFFAKELMKRSPLLQAIATSAELKKNMSFEEAKSIIEERLKLLNNPELDKVFAQVAKEDMVKIGIVFYLIMNGISNVSQGTDGEAKFGAAMGVFMMYTLSNFILMPELLLMGRSYGEKIGNNSTTTKFMQLALALTALYMIQASTLNFVFGISPTLAYVLSGKYVFDNGDKEDVEFGGQNGANRFLFSLGINAGILLKNAIMIRLIYSLGISKIYKEGDPTMFMWALALTVPFTVFSGN